MLLVVLLVLAGLLMILATVASTQNTNFKSEINRLELDRARIMAESGIQRAMTELATTSPNTVNQQGTWYTLGNNGDDHFLVGGDSFRLQIIDASSLINLNTAPEAELRLLPLTQEQIDSFLDWRTAGFQPRPDGAKDQYYNGLQYPYNAKLSALDSMDELMLVKGFSASTVYEPQNVNGSNPVGSVVNGQQNTQYATALCNLATVDSNSPNTTPTGAQKQNINTASLQTLVRAGIQARLANAIITRRRSGNFTSLNQVLSVPGMTIQAARPILSGFSTSNGANVDGLINLNTVTQNTLNYVPNMQLDISSAILTRQSSGFTSLADLASIPGVNIATLRNLADLFTVGSRRFIVRVIGTAGDTNVPLEAVITVNGTTPQITKITTPPYSDMITRWAWNTTTNNDIDLNGQQ